MTVQLKTTAEISATIVGQLEAALSQTIPLLPKAFLRVLAKVLAAVYVMLYKYGGFMFLQQFIQTATDDPTEINGQIVRPLTAWGRAIGVGDRTAATKAELEVEVVVLVQTGTLPTGTQFLADSNGVVYLSTSAVALDASTKTVTVRASSDQQGGDGSGVIGNLDVAAEMSFISPPANVERVVAVTAQTVTGADAEGVEAYRTRVIDRFSKRPQGGAYADYELWSEAVEGIINAYPYTGDPGQVDVYSEATEASSGSADGIPTGAQLTAIGDAIESDLAGLATRRPVGALVNSLPITRTAFDVNVISLTVDDTAAAETAIVDAIGAHFLEREPFIPGVSVGTRRDQITAAAVAGVVYDIVAAFGGVFEGVVVLEASAEIDLRILGKGEKAKAGTVGFV